MKYKAFLIILLSVLLIQCSNDKNLDNKKKIVWKNVFNGQKVTHTFTINNNYNKIMKIGYIRPQCPACTTFELDKKEIEPGESAKLKVIFDSAGYDGRIVYNLLVYHNLDPNNKPIEYLTIAEVVNHVKSSHKLLLNFGTFNPLKDKTKKITLKLSSKLKDENINIKKIEQNKYKILDYNVKDITPKGKNIVFTVRLSNIMKNLKVNINQMRKLYAQRLKGKYSTPAKFYIKQENNLTRFAAPVKIYTGMPKHPFIRYVAIGLIKGNIQTNLKGNVISFNDILKHISKGIDFSKNKSFLIYSNKGKPFRILNIYSDNETITLNKVRLSGSKYKINVIFNKDKKTIKSLKSNRGNILIETDNPYSRLIRAKLELN